MEGSLCEGGGMKTSPELDYSGASLVTEIWIVGKNLCTHVGKVRTDRLP